MKIIIMNIMHLNVTMHHTYHSPLKKHRCKLVKLTEMVVAVTQNLFKASYAAGLRQYTARASLIVTALQQLLRLPVPEEILNIIKN